MALAYVAAKRKAPLSIFYFNMESQSFPSNPTKFENFAVHLHLLRYAELSERRYAEHTNANYATPNEAPAFHILIQYARQSLAFSFDIAKDAMPNTSTFLRYAEQGLPKTFLRKKLRLMQS